MDCLIYCPCNTDKPDPQQIIKLKSRHHDLNDLLYCPSCQLPKCKYCCQHQFVKKYCINCTTDYSTTDELNCTKKCFTCPDCDSMLSIAVKDRDNGKVFYFSCGFCDYVYNTQTIIKPRSIYSIIKSEYQIENTNYELFNRVLKIHKYKLNHEILSEQVVRSVKTKKLTSRSKDLIENLEKSGLNPLNDENISELDKIIYVLQTNKTFDHESPELHQLYKDGITIFNDQNSNIPKGKKFPVPKKLIVRNSIKCCDCNQILQHPSEESVSSKSLTKFTTKFFANDFLPLVTITPLINHQFPEIFVPNTQYNLLINIVNPLSSSCTISLSSPQSYKVKETEIQTTIPKREITLGAYGSDDHPVRTIPTAHLTKATKVSRAEIMMRQGKLSMEKRDPDDILSLVETNDNWGCLPIEIILLQQELTNFMIPIYVNVKSKLPGSVRALGLSKQELSFGYWVVVKIKS